MREHEEKSSGENEGVKFDIRYRDLLDTLKRMPRETTEEKENRYCWLRNHERYDDFIVDVFKMCKPADYEKLCRKLGDACAGSALNPDSGMASMKKKEFDPKVLMEAVYSAVKDYTGKNRQGETYSFLQSVGIKYKQSAEKEAGKNDAGLLGSSTPTRNICYVLKLARKVKEILEYTNGEKTLDEAIMICIKDSSHKFTRQELKDVVDIVNGLNITVSLSQPSSEETETEDNCNGIEQWENEEETRLFWEKFTEKFLVSWQMVEAATDIGNRELLKFFLSKDILILLKLFPLSDEERVQYREYLEPKCRQWCYRRKHCPLDSHSDTIRGCYVRYGNISGDNRTGDELIYGYLKACQGDMYKTIFDNKYIQSAYQGNVKNLNDMYEKMLKDHKAENEDDRFEFTDVFMVNATGIKKAKLSKCRKYYENTAKMELYKIFSF